MQCLTTWYTWVEMLQPDVEVSGVRKLDHTQPGAGIASGRGDHSEHPWHGPLDPLLYACCEAPCFRNLQEEL